MERRTGKIPPGLQGPELPPDAEHIWQWFLDLNSARGSNGFGVNPISYQDIAAWSSLTGTIVRPSEVAALKALDAVWLGEVMRAEKPAPEARS